MSGKFIDGSVSEQDSGISEFHASPYYEIDSGCGLFVLMPAAVRVHTVLFGPTPQGFLTSLPGTASGDQFVPNSVSAMRTMPQRRKVFMRCTISALSLTPMCK